MMKKTSFTDAPSQRETKWGLVYLPVSLLVLPTLLQAGNGLLAAPLSAARLNFVYYCINFAAVVWIFRRFLNTQLKAALRIPFPVLWYAILGYLGSQALGELLGILIYLIFPGFVNVNDQSVTALLGQDFRLMAFATILLVPVAEETLYRGLIFRGLYGKSPIAAYLVSMGVFAAIHVIGYIGTFDPLHLLLCFVQYLPAGFCLAWCYRQTGTILTPILMHLITNAMGVYYAVR